MIKNLLLIIKLFLFCEVIVADEVTTFYKRNFLNWISAYDLRFYKSSLANTNKVIARPTYVWRRIFRLRTLEDIDRGNSYCVYYRIPMINNKVKKFGSLRVVKIKDFEKCKDSLPPQYLNSIDGIESLKIYFYQKRYLLLEEEKSLEQFALYMRMKIKNKTHWLKFPTYNIRSTKLNFSFSNLNTVLKRYDSGISESYKKGVIVYPLKENHNNITENKLSVKKEKSKIIGPWNASYIKGDLRECHRLQKNCNRSKSSNCFDCHFGWFSAISSNCNKMPGVRFCGPSKCGKRGEPACPRGFFHARLIANDFCFKDSPAGFCEKGLNTYCDENKVLICL